MGCRTRGYKFELCSGTGVNTDHCDHYTPSSGGVTFEFQEYPQNVIRSGNYNIPGREDNRVMYPFTQTMVSTSTGGSTGSGTGTSAANCGKLSRPNSCNTFSRGSDGAVSTLFQEYYPTELSFDFGFSDTWFSYLYDTSDDSGIVGIPCYHIETETRSGDGGGSRQICHPCTAFTSTPGETLIRYTAEEDLTGDPDCPHPTLFGIGTTSNKVVFSYNQLSTILPNGVTDFSLSYDGVTYADAWDSDNNNPIVYESSQNPWQAGEEFVSEFEIYDFSSGATKADFIVKARIEPIYDDSGASTVFTGTRWIITEFLNPGTGYAVNDTFSMSFLHTHPDNSQSTFTMNIKVTAVGPVDNTTNQTGFDVLRVNDKINGHTITRTFHTEIGEFPYHIIYVDGDGLDFTKDTQYTSDRNHIITAKAGYGIPDRACLVGLYEFLNKSLQFVTADINRNAPEAFNSIAQPAGFITITNGAVTDISFSGEVLSLDINNIKDNLKDAYSDADNVSLTGGSGSGLVVNVRVGDDNSINALEIVNPGQNYISGEELTIPGSVKPAGSATNAKVRISVAANPGSGFQDLKVAPILEISPSPAEPIDAKNDAVIEGTFVGGSLSSVIIKKGGSGYDEDAPPSIFVNNVNEIITEIVNNDAYRADLVPEFQDILKSTPIGPEGTEYETTVSGEDLQKIEDVYSEVPASTDVRKVEPPFEVKLDPDRKRIDQLPQQKYSSDATAPLKDIMVTDYDLTYLQNTDVPNEYKDRFAEEKQRSAKQIRSDIDDITQKQIPEFKSLQDAKVETCVGSFTNLPTATTFTKYLMRQYRADPAKETSIEVSLTCIPADIGCSHFTCTPPGVSSGYSEEVDTGQVDENGQPITTTYTYSYGMSPLLGPGAREWTATGKMKIFHDLTNSARTVTLATDAYGNPFDK